MSQAATAPCVLRPCVVSPPQTSSRPWDEVYGEIRDREMKLLNALTDGKVSAGAALKDEP